MLYQLNQCLNVIHLHMAKKMREAFHGVIFYITYNYFLIALSFPNAGFPRYPKVEFSHETFCKPK